MDEEVHPIDKCSRKSAVTHWNIRKVSQAQRGETIFQKVAMMNIWK